MKASHILALIGVIALLAAPGYVPIYLVHLLIQILLLGFIYTAWSMMGRFGLISLGHGALHGVGAYVPALLWNYYGVTRGSEFHAASRCPCCWRSSLAIPAFG
jgi:branched-chain amino acid transport system permease protein